MWLGPVNNGCHSPDRIYSMAKVKGFADVIKVKSPDSELIKREIILCGPVLA